MQQSDHERNMDALAETLWEQKYSMLFIAAVLAAIGATYPKQVWGSNLRDALHKLVARFICQSLHLLQRLAGLI